MTIGGIGVLSENGRDPGSPFLNYFTTLILVADGFALASIGVVALITSGCKGSFLMSWLLIVIRRAYRGRGAHGTFTFTSVERRHNHGIQIVCTTTYGLANGRDPSMVESGEQMMYERRIPIKCCAFGDYWSRLQFLWIPSSVILSLDDLCDDNVVVL